MRLLTVLAVMMSLVTVSEGSAREVGRWVGGEETSALTDQKNVWFNILSENVVPNSTGDQHAMMSVMCQQGDIVVLFRFNSYMGSELVPIRYRVDQGSIKSSAVDSSASGKSFGYWHFAGLDLLSEIEHASRFVISASPFEEPPSEAIFDIEGIKTVIENVSAACARR